jgi:hypothetical protein
MPWTEEFYNQRASCLAVEALGGQPQWRFLHDIALKRCFVIASAMTLQVTEACRLCFVQLTLYHFALSTIPLFLTNPLSLTRTFILFLQGHLACKLPCRV